MWFSCHVVVTKLYLSHQLSSFSYWWDHSGSPASGWGKHRLAVLPWRAVGVNLCNIAPPPSAHTRIMQLCVGFLAGFSGNMSTCRKAIKQFWLKMIFRPGPVCVLSLWSSLLQRTCPVKSQWKANVSSQQISMSSVIALFCSTLMLFWKPRLDLSMFHLIHLLHCHKVSYLPTPSFLIKLGKELHSKCYV